MGSLGSRATELSVLGAAPPVLSKRGTLETQEATVSRGALSARARIVRAGWQGQAMLSRYGTGTQVRSRATAGHLTFAAPAITGLNGSQA
jgi:hypothetical protein